jgi:hypothetical protein
MDILSIENPILVHFRRFSQFRHLKRFGSLFTNSPSTTVESALQIRLFYAKQSQFSGLHNDVNSVYTKDYEEIRRKEVMKKQTQFKPKQTQFNERPKMNAVAWIRILTMILIMLLADSITLKGANFPTHNFL